MQQRTPGETLGIAVRGARVGKCGSVAGALLGEGTAGLNVQERLRHHIVPAATMSNLPMSNGGRERRLSPRKRRTTGNAEAAYVRPVALSMRNARCVTRE